MVSGKIQNIRSKVEKREILQYLLLRERVLRLSENKSKTPSAKVRNKARHSEITMLINHIREDTIRSKVKKLHQQIHIENDYAKKTKEELLLSEDRKNAIKEIKENKLTATEYILGEEKGEKK